MRVTPSDRPTLARGQTEDVVHESDLRDGDVIVLGRAVLVYREQLA